MPLTPTGAEIYKLNIRLCARRTMDVRIRIGHLLATAYAVTRLKISVSDTLGRVHPKSGGLRRTEGGVSLQSGFLYRDTDC